MPLAVSTPPERINRRGNTLDMAVDAKDRKQLIRNPGMWFQILDWQNKPRVFTSNQVAAMAQICNKERLLRIKSSMVDDNKNTRHVWVCYDPAYWEYMASVDASKRSSRARKQPKKLESENG